LYNNENLFIKSYLKDFPGFYATGDSGTKDPNGNIFFMSRNDDIIKVSAHRLSTSAMEEALCSHKGMKFI
jgi:propionyl-CoA synthetase